ncbi:MAG: twin-arginine translocase TatA/TatE family subunit [Gammaproteobacteria bacterium]
MFDIGWSEILFIATLALVVVGPRDLPKFIHIVGHGVGRLRRTCREGLATLHRLEREIDIASRPALGPPGEPEYYALLPEHVREMLRRGEAEPLRDAAAHVRRAAEIDTALDVARRRHASLVDFPDSGASPPHGEDARN